MNPLLTAVRCVPSDRSAVLTVDRTIAYSCQSVYSWETSHREHRNQGNLTAHGSQKRFLRSISASISPFHKRGLPPDSESSRSARAFSLIELLSVIAIISVLVAASIPALSSLGGAANLTGDGNTLANLATSAREYSLAHNTITALVGVTTLQSNPEANYRAFIVLKRDEDGKWSPLGKWFRLSNQVAMSNQLNNTFLQFKGSYTNVNFPSLTLDGSAVDISSNCSYQFFLPDGRMDASDPILLRLVPTGGSSPNRYDLIFNPNTGTVKIDRS